MYLIYTDETGKSFGKNKLNLYSDGPFFIYGGLPINFNSYDLIENAFKDLCKEILGVNNIYEIEIHAGNIFKRNKNFEHLTEGQSFLFFNEILQLVSKFNLTLIAGIVYKDATIFGDISNNLNKLKLMSSSIYAFFNILDNFLSYKNSKGIIIADELSESRYKDINFLKEEKNLLGREGRGEPKIDILMNRIFFEKLNRFSEEDFKSILKFQYAFESKIYFILDNIHFVKSNLSPLTQLTDILLFLLNIYLEKYYLEQDFPYTYKDFYKSPLYAKKLKLLENIEDSIASFLRNRHLFGAFKSENDYFSLWRKSLDDYFGRSGELKTVRTSLYIRDLIKMQAPTSMV